MILKDYHVAGSIDEVVELMNKSKRNRILAGNHWTKMNTSRANIGIDISRLGLDTIEETDESIIIGGDVSLRELETNTVIKIYYPVLQKAVSHIVGVQLRNTARVGASIFSRFGFSDVTASLLLLDTEVEINGDELVDLETYLDLPRSKHFVTRIIIKKEIRDCWYESMKKSATDFPSVIVGVSCHEGEWRVVAGSRPGVPVLARQTMTCLNENMSDMDELKRIFSEEIVYGTNNLATKAYRAHAASVLLSRGVQALCR